MKPRGEKEYHYAGKRKVLFDVPSRFEKAEKIFLILKEKFHGDLNKAKLLDIGCSAGLIDCWLADKVKLIWGIDIDEDAKVNLKELEKKKRNFRYKFASGDSLPFEDNQFDIVISNIMYYLLPHEKQEIMFKEIRRVLKEDGVCYLAAPNRLLLLDGKYRLPFLCWMPVWLGRLYTKTFSPIKEYNEYYKTLFGLKSMLKKWFFIEDITLEVIDNNNKYGFMADKSKLLQTSMKILSRPFYFFMPNYIFILRKRQRHDS